MTIQLTTPMQMPAVHGQPAETNNEVKIVAIGIVPFGEYKEITMTCQYGNTDQDGDWAPSTQVPKMVHTIENTEATVDPDTGGELVPADPAFDLYVASSFPSSLQNTLYDEVAESLYQHLIDEGIYAGTIV